MKLFRREMNLYVQVDGKIHEVSLSLVATTEVALPRAEAGRQIIKGIQEAYGKSSGRLVSVATIESAVTDILDVRQQVRCARPVAAPPMLKLVSSG